MSIFKMFPTKSENKEAINKIQASNKNEAITMFSKIKKLTLSQFNKLFTVEKIKDDGRVR
jgi:hypothetical protein